MTVGVGSVDPSVRMPSMPSAFRVKRRDVPAGFLLRAASLENSALEARRTEPCQHPMTIRGGGRPKQAMVSGANLVRCTRTLRRWARGRHPIAYVELPNILGLSPCAPVS